MDPLFPPFQPGSPDPEGTRRRAIPLRVLIPNMITLLALCAGMTAIRLAIENKLDLAIGCIVVAALLDGVDGRVARYLKGTSKFGAELDSLADFVNFGVVPGIVLYFWGLHDLRSIGWIGSLVFAICMVLRLARFNVTSSDPNRPAFQANFFTGMPAPAGACTVLLPIYLDFLGLTHEPSHAKYELAYVLLIAFLMISTIPTFSGKKLGNRIPREWVLPIFVVAVVVVMLLALYPWESLTSLTVGYLATIPFGVLYYRKQARAYQASLQVERKGE
ncbi:CDP-diacylglycerol--serine O-phosphatidyltransferase [Labrys sp. WJW]|jgi:CDP-diacylglycerol--serine O-phosphatidyltransferase|uniref:CDP-diacylglycerol--serine O-phosphatidyltransferase n=1 Tax=Labrys sp. WJW TaxID=1737983 RepID=UPI000831AB55|nr:CDP-diacylglycerol--serine O-phosphatidyltransferase [Labrys sp. WJW]OCC01907.1 CDP-diacylglycerol--serine O-phosphatidyltransferase [Labrys sp. WJW]